MNQADIERKLEEFREIGKANFIGVRRRLVEEGVPPAQTNWPDLYAECFLSLIDRMRANPMPQQCLPWLAEAHATLHRLLTKVLQDRLEELWDKRAPIGAFQFILDRIWDAHRTARELYAAHTAGQAQTKPTDAPKTLKGDFRTPTGDGGAG